MSSGSDRILSSASTWRHGPEITKEGRIDELEQLLRQVQAELPRRDPRIALRLSNRPDWFRRLGEVAGLDALETRLEVSLPRSVRLFYQYPALACWHLEYHDTDVFLSDDPVGECPHLVRWYGRRHLVLAEFSHSQTIFAVDLDSENPQLLWGGDYASVPLVDFKPFPFVDWLIVGARELLGLTESSVASDGKKGGDERSSR